MEETERSLHDAIIDFTAVSIFVLSTPSLQCIVIVRSEIVEQALYGKNLVLVLCKTTLRSREVELLT